MELCPLKLIGLPGLLPPIRSSVPFSFSPQVLHPKNPFAPTLHFNYSSSIENVQMLLEHLGNGGGTDLTPAYIFEKDVKHFHLIQKKACDKFDPSFYPLFKKWCDDNFYIKLELEAKSEESWKITMCIAFELKKKTRHRGERRGLGGIFFDDLNDYDQEMLLSFATECTNSVVPAYIPIERLEILNFTFKYTSFVNGKVYNRGTTFGLKTGGRIESILVSLPLSARWEYDHKREVKNGNC